MAGGTPMSPKKGRVEAVVFGPASAAYVVGGGHSPRLRTAVATDPRKVTEHYSAPALTVMTQHVKPR
jgi:hypothetical protein